MLTKKKEFIYITDSMYPGTRDWVLSLGWEDALEKGKATHSSVLAWRVPWTL